ncbi:MAG: hypothetical protein EXR58_01035 [Chloroflexi bacterium]|nr:hypothetical protein [Chloroflexota bacterium]
MTGATFGILVQGTIGCVHTQPGVQSELRGFLRFTAVAPAADFGGSGGLLDVAMIDEGTDEGADSMLPPDLDGGGHGPAGAPFPSTFTVEGGGPGLIQNIFSGTVGENGVGTFVLPIRALGAYRVALTGLNDIAITDIPNLSADGFPLTFNVGATCTPPANFP